MIVATEFAPALTTRRAGHWRNVYRVMRGCVWDDGPGDERAAPHQWPCPQKAEQVALSAIAAMAKRGKWLPGEVVYVGARYFEGAAS